MSYFLHQVFHLSIDTKLTELTFSHIWIRASLFILIGHLRSAKHMEIYAWVTCINDYLWWLTDKLYNMHENNKNVDFI